ncbi:MAG: hypothetical protein ACOCX4_09165, partial [Planctomycetota bacterium]
MARRKQTTAGEWQAALKRARAEDPAPVTIVHGGQEWFRRETVETLLAAFRAARPEAGVAAYQGPASPSESPLRIEAVLGERAGFFADYLAFLRAGGPVDGFAGLPANIFSGYAADLAAFYAFLEGGGVPSSYALLDPATLREYVAALEAAGASGRFLGDLAGFWRDYAAFLAGGGNPDTFAQLPVPPDFPAFAAALNAYATFLAGGGLPSDYDAAALADLAAFLEAVASAGRLEELLGANADLLSAYFAFLEGGGSVDGFAGLPLYADYVAALNAYFGFLAGGGLPGDYTVLDQATIEAYLAALASAQGGLAGFAGLEDFFADYFAFIAGGGDPDRFAGLPLYADYVAALNAYFDFLAG